MMTFFSSKAVGKLMCCWRKLRVVWLCWSQ